MVPGAAPFKMLKNQNVILWERIKYRRGAVVKGVEHISTIVLVNI